ncbi:MAG: ATP-binding protein [Vicinamibacterales bacterium]
MGAAAAKRLEVSTACAPATRSLPVDAAKVHDIVRNLVENAVNYTQDGGAVSVAASVDGGTRSC